jgi:hypothetical protein
MAQPEDQVTPVAEEDPIRSLFELSGPATPYTSSLDRAQDMDLLGPATTFKPSTGEKAMAVGAGALKGAPVGLGVSAATIEGGRIGFGLTKSPYGAGVGALIGLGTGLAGASYLNPLLESQVPPRYLQDPDLIPYFQGGSTLGEVVGSAPTLFRIPVMQGGRVANFISNIGEGTRKAPIASMTAETITGAGAGLAGGMALAYDPTNEGLRMVAEMAGGLYSPPLRAISTAGFNAKDIVSSVLGRYSESGREAKAATYLQRILNQAGEDPQELVRLLTVDLPPGVPEPTAGQKTGSLALNALESTLGKNNPAFGSQLGPQGMATFQALENMLDQLRTIGDPEALTAAARLENQFFNNRLAERLIVAEQNAAQAIQRIGPRNPRATQEVGRILSDEVFSALDDARAYGDALWRQAELEAVNVTPGQFGLSDAVITPRKLEARNSSRGMMEAITSVSPEYFRAMPGGGTAMRIARRFGITPETMSVYNDGKLSMPYLQSETVPDNYVRGVVERNVSDMIQARSDLLKLSRVNAKADPNAARIYGEMAEAIHADLDLLDFPAYDRARAYTRELNDFYSRTFAGEATSRRRTGALALPPEVLVQRAFGNYTDVTFARMDQAMASVGGLNTRYQRLLEELGPDHPQVLELQPFAERSARGAISMREAQQQWLLLGAQRAFKETIDENGRVSTALNKDALDRFILDNRPYLAAAGLLADLQNVSTAEATLRQVVDANSAFNKGVAQQAAFSRVLGNQNINPTQTVYDALNSNNPVTQMRRLVTLARNGGPNAVEGLKSIVYDYAFTQGGGNRNFSPTAYYEALFDPINGIRGKPSMVNMMESAGLISSTEIGNLQRVLRPMRTIEESLQNTQQIEDALAKPTSAMETLMASYIGSKIGALGSGSAQSLVLAGRGASIARDMLLNKPSMLIQDVLQTAVRDPRKMSTLLTRITPENQVEIARRLSAQFGGSLYTGALTGGIINPLLYEEQEQPDVRGAYSSPYSEPAQPAPRPQPPAPPTRGAPMPAPEAPPAEGSAPPQAQVQGSPNASSREMLSQLFPFDTTLRA